MINSALATGCYFQLGENTKALCCLPVKFIAGKMMLVRALTLGWDLDVIESTSNPLQEITKEYMWISQQQIIPIDAFDNSCMDCV